MIPEIGREEANVVKKSQQAMLKLAQKLKESNAETLVMISPHAPVFRDGIAINFAPRLKGNLAGFRAPQLSFDLANDLFMAQEIKKQAGDLNIEVILLENTEHHYGFIPELDHGLMVPLYFLQKGGIDLPLVAISMGLFPFPQLYTFGVAIQRAAINLKKKVAVLASGDLSHRLFPDAPAGYEPRGKEFDQKVVQLIGEADVKGIINLDRELIERAGECGLRPIIMMLGAFDGFNLKPSVLSYEGPFGVGYMVAAIKPEKQNPARNLLAELYASQQKKIKKREQQESPSFLVQVARQTLENYYQGKQKAYPTENIPPEFAKRAGVFVSLKKHGNLRGCIGTIIPQCKNIVEEVANNAISSATRDPRFYPVEIEELDELEISVDVLTEPEPIKGLEELDPKRYGVIVCSGGRSGLLLPDLEGIDTPAQQVAIARQKAGIGPNEPVKLERFEVIRYK
jgi:AmmeMemoRadiSam system protein A